MNLPDTMRVVTMREAGPPDVLSIGQLAVPAPRDHEVLIEVAFAGAAQYSA